MKDYTKFQVFEMGEVGTIIGKIYQKYGNLRTIKEGIGRSIYIENEKEGGKRYTDLSPKRLSQIPKTKELSITCTRIEIEQGIMSKILLGQQIENNENTLLLFYEEYPLVYEGCEKNTIEARKYDSLIYLDNFGEYDIEDMKYIENCDFQTNVYLLVVYENARLPDDLSENICRKMRNFLAILIGLVLGFVSFCLFILLLFISFVI